MSEINKISRNGSNVLKVESLIDESYKWDVYITAVKTENISKLGSTDKIFFKVNGSKGKEEVLQSLRKKYFLQFGI